jgi:integrase
MPRRARPWFRADRMEWHVTHLGKQVALGVTDPTDLAGALAAHQQLLTSHPVGPPPTPPPAATAGPTVAEVCTRFLAAAERRVARGKLAAKGLYDYRLALTPFEARFSSRPAADLATEAGAEEVEDWAAAQGWSPSTQNTYLGVVLSAFKLAELRTQIRRPPKESRGAGAVWTEDQFAAILADLRTPRRGRGAGDLADLLEALRLTGARPQELAPLTADGVGWATATVTLVEHKTRRHTGRERVVYLTAAAIAVFERQRAKHPTGPLFPTQAGKPYSARAIVRRLLAASERLGFRVFAYATRHTFATALLSAGEPDAIVAELLGHTSAAMVGRHYGHVAQNSRRLREAAERAGGKRAG